MLWVIPVQGLVWVGVAVYRSPLGSVIGCACLSDWVSYLGWDETSGTVIEQSQRTTPPISHVVQHWEHCRVWVQWCWWWEDRRVSWPCTHLCVLSLQWRRAAFPGQVSGTISLGTVLGLETRTGSLCHSPACVNNQRSGVCGWGVPFPSPKDPSQAAAKCSYAPGKTQGVCPAPGALSRARCPQKNQVGRVTEYAKLEGTHEHH